MSVAGKNDPPLHPATSGAPGAWSICAPSARPSSTYRVIFSSWAGVWIAAMSTHLSIEFPRRSVVSRLRSLARRRGAIDSWTRSRDPAQQTWPWFIQIASTHPSVAESRSAPWKTTMADLPPSSIVSLHPVPASDLRMLRPTGVLPVNAILSSPGCVERCCAISLSPLTTFTTPAGIPASRTIWQKAQAVRRVEGAGLSTIVHPVASAGATFHASMSSGKFQGMIAPTTPTASYPRTSESITWAQPAWW
mmetsp:Transcript_39679/g.93994  ORF Transcript_39679/g.93994 Transcript_39679/m.93994 type:complete len:249 (-) Transcript_39679:618-1364(-)